MVSLMIDNAKVQHFSCGAKRGGVWGVKKC